MAQMKQVGLAFAIFVGDRNDQYPPAVYRAGDYEYQLTWDDQLHSSLGGSAPQSDLLLGITDREYCPRMAAWPTDCTANVSITCFTMATWKR
jgi:hypothetical protein